MTLRRWLLMWAFRLAVVAGGLLLLTTAPLWAPPLVGGWLYLRHRKAANERRMMELLIARGVVSYAPGLSLVEAPVADGEEPAP